MFTVFYRSIMKSAGPFLLLPLVLLLAACSSGSDGPQSYANTIAQMTASIQKQLADSGAIGGVSDTLAYMRGLSRKGGSSLQVLSIPSRRARGDSTAGGEVQEKVRQSEIFS